MTHPSRRYLLRQVAPWSVGLVLLALGSAAHGADAPPGVIVEEVTAGTAPAQAGIQPGDEIVAWSREARPPANPEAAQGSVTSPFDMAWLSLEQAPRGHVTLTGRRGGVTTEWTLRSDDWRWRVRASLSSSEYDLYREAGQLEESNSAVEAAARWRQAAAEANDAGDRPLAAWLLKGAGQALSAARGWDEADAAYREGLEALTQADERVWAALLAEEWCRSTVQRGMQPTLECYDRALALAEEAAPGSLLQARFLSTAGRISLYVGDLKQAESRFLRALEIQEKECPESSWRAVSLNNLGGLALQHDDLEAAEDYYRQAVAISESVEPGSVWLASYLNNLGDVVRQRGDLNGAQELQLRAYDIRRRLAPGSLGEAASLGNLGIIALNRGDLATAERNLSRTLQMWESSEPESINVVEILNHLGLTATVRGDLAAAEGFFAQALARAEKQGPTNITATDPLESLGKVALERGDVAAAETWWRRALARREELAPGSLKVATILDDLGRAARAKGDLAGAEESYRRALAIREQKAAGSLAAAESLYHLGDLARVRGDAAAAQSNLRAALAIQERLAPGSADVASTLHALGLTHEAAAEREPAVTALCSAVDALEAQRARLGGTDEARSAFGLRYGEYYHDCMTGLIEQGRAADAYKVLERSRARSLLQMLAERDVTFSGTLTPELARESRLIDTAYDRVQASIAALDPAKDGARIETLLAQLRELRGKQGEIAARAREASPRFASLRYPQPLDLAAARDALDPGTALLAYSVGNDETLLFTVLPSGVAGPGLSVLSIGVGSKDLREKAEAFRSAILPRSRASRETLLARGAELYDLLVRPAEAQLATGQRLLFSPDGPLHSLPFGALVREAPGTSRGAPQYLVEWRPIHIVASATLYAEIKRARRETSPQGALVAFGDPLYPKLARADQGTNPDVRDAVERGLELTPLPLTRDEVMGISKLFPGTSRTYLGAEATEERAKSLERDVRYVHFACHGTLDERFPLNSALALTIPAASSEGKDNGLLQAWEIFDNLRIDADLVTLSACQTGLGVEMGGEGLLGLTRAFLYAGARSVVGSLWAVSDRSTPRLMKRFYTHLESGRARDEALRAAQIELIRSKPAAGQAWAASPSHPFHWAAFQLSGDWR